MARKSYEDQAKALLENESKLGNWARLAAMQAALVAEAVMTGHIKGTVGARLTAAQRVLDFAKTIVEELKGYDDGKGQRKRGSAPAKSRGSTGARQAWVGGDTQHHPDGTPDALGGAPVELPDGDRPPE